MQHFRRLAKGYIQYILLGAFLLFLPISHKSGNIPAFVDVLFTATSAITTTGLGVINTSEYSVFGQMVILVLIQLGGIGFMTFGAFLIMARTTEINSDAVSILDKSFTLPAGFDMNHFIKRLIIYTFIIEIIGAILLLPFFIGVPGDVNPIWSAIFHSVSAFCTAGFSLYPDNLAMFVNNAPVNIIISTLSILGAIGFIVVTDVTSVIKRQQKTITFTSKIILFGILTATLMTMALNAVYTDLPILENMFHTVSALSGAGFNTSDVATYANITAMLLMVVMFIGGAPSGTSGGIKITSFTALLAGVKGYIIDMPPTIMGHQVPNYRIRSAFAVTITYIALLAVGIIALTAMLPGVDFVAIIFEVFSALGTVGLSFGITSTLTFGAKVVLIILMFAGRIGTKTIFFLALSIREKDLHTAKKIKASKIKKCSKEDIAC